MAKYIVKVREVHIQGVEIEAETPDDAAEKVSAGDGEIIEGMFEFSHTEESETWTVEEADGKEVWRGWRD